MQDQSAKYLLRCVQPKDMVALHINSSGSKHPSLNTGHKPFPEHLQARKQVRCVASQNLDERLR